MLPQLQEYWIQKIKGVINIARITWPDNPDWEVKMEQAIRATTSADEIIQYVANLQSLLNEKVPDQARIVTLFFEYDNLKELHEVNVLVISILEKELAKVTATLDILDSNQL